MAWIAAVALPIPKSKPLRYSGRTLTAPEFMHAQHWALLALLADGRSHHIRTLAQQLGRSQQAAEYFLGQGFTKVANLRGGIDAWSVEVDPSVPRY